jgi:hypothetical protein
VPAGGEEAQVTSRDNATQEKQDIQVEKKYFAL